MSNLLELCDLYVDLENRALICRKCKYALATTNYQVTTHLDKKHHVPQEYRKGLTRYIREHPCQFLNPANIPLRPDGSPPHPELQVYEGHACRECTFRTTNLKLLTSHLSKSHLRQHASKPRIDGLYDDVFLQTWGDGPRRDYWTVSVNGSVIRPVILPGAYDHLRSVCEREQIRRKEQEQAAMTDTGAQTLQSTGVG